MATNQISFSQTAQGGGLNHLYRYEQFNAQYLADTLSRQRVHLSDPKKLNDPWDCRPWFSQSTVDDLGHFESFMNFLFSVKGAKWTSKPEQEALKAGYRHDLQARRELFKKFCEDFQSYIPERWRILCLTPVPDSTLMWSHYADQHRGLCLQFSLNNIFGAAMQVRYHESYPLWMPHLLNDSGVTEILLTKSADWAYEREYRLIGFGGGIARPYGPNNPLELKGDFLDLPPGALEAVIVGCEANFGTIAEIVKELAPSLKIKRMVRAPNEYKLQIVEQ